MNFILTLIIFIIILGVIVTIHEFGHFIAAKKRGVYVDEFAIGMGPKLFSFRRKNDETLYSVRLLPLGGFNAIAMDKGDFDIDEERTLSHKKYGEKMFILINGIFFNFILTIVLLFCNGLFFGSPVLSPYIGDVQEGSPAMEGGLKHDDLILSINDKKVSSWDDVFLELDYLQKDNKEMTFNIDRDGEKLSLVINPILKENNEGEKVNYFGFSIGNKKEHGFVNALKYSFTGFYDMGKSLFKVLGNLFTGKIGVNNLSGPIGIFNVVDQVKNNGLESILYLTAYLSINVGIINLLPISIFDGGRILIYTIERIRNKKLKPKTIDILNNIGVVFLILLFVFVMINDILKLL